jgi:protein involved in polysaccharide export with SLBB domain
MSDHLSQDRRRLWPLSRVAGALALPAVAFWGIACAGGGNGVASEPLRDFPPLRPPGEPPVPTRITDRTPEELAATEKAPEELPYVYRLGVGDQLSVVVLGQPEFTRPVKVLPDGSITAPGAGTVYVLGKTADEVSQELQTRLQKVILDPRVQVIVTEYGEHVVYVMGEVGLSALQAVAQAGGFLASAKRSSVVVLRRIAPDLAEFYQLNLRDPLHGKGLSNDLELQPYDIIYVPKTFIADVNTFVDQWFGQNIAALNFYLNGWDSYKITKDQVIVRTIR